MDNLSHSLAGLILARAGLNRGDKNTALLLVLAANVPDVDRFAALRDSIAYLEVHAGYSHALALVPLLALLPIALVKLGEKFATMLRERGYTLAALQASLNLTGTDARKGLPQLKIHRPFTIVRFFYLWLCCILAVLSHLLLDWTTVYGLRMLLPFSNEWMHLDLTNTIDPVILATLVIAAAVPVIVTTVHSEVGASQSRSVGLVWAWIALIAIPGYEYARFQSHAALIEQLKARLYRGQQADHASAFPDSFDPFQWRALVQLGKVFLEIPVTYTNGKYALELRNAPREYQAGKSPALDAARKTRLFRVFESFNQAPLWRLYPRGDNIKVELMDMRFGTFRYPEMSASALIDPYGSVLETNVRLSRRP